MEVFDTQLSFEEIALKIFRLQASNCEIYKHYLDLLKTPVDSVTSIASIPFLPISFFKSHTILANEKSAEIVFKSSGTTGQESSHHHVADLNLYTKSFRKGFELFYGNPANYRILALLPSYLEREGSSLVYMCEHLIKDSQDPKSGFYLHNLDQLNAVLNESTKRKTLLIGVSYALLDLAEQFPQKLEDTIVMETGGMKGKRAEMTKQELHHELKTAFQIKNIHSEYGMTELLSQAYSNGGGIFQTPPWMKIIIREPQDPLSLLPHGKTGGINIIDLANIHSCSFIATEDLGQTRDDNRFELKGRFTQADIRGCNLLLEQ